MWIVLQMNVKDASVALASGWDRRVFDLRV